MDRLLVASVVDVLVSSQVGLEDVATSSVPIQLIEVLGHFVLHFKCKRNMTVSHKIRPHPDAG